MRVGRAPIDEEAIRLLEQHNPDVEFEWTRILRDPAPDSAVRRERDGRDRDRRDRRDSRPPQRPRPAEIAGAAVPGPVSVAVDPQDAAEAAERRAAAHADIVLSHEAIEGGGATQPIDAGHRGDAETGDAGAVAEAAWTGESVALEHHEPLAADHTEYSEYVAASAAAGELAVDGEPAQPLSAAAARLGSEGLVRLRARYAEVMARISEQPMDEPAREELKTKAERLNPDGWVTADEVTAALEQYETIFESVRAVVGRRPTDRRRRR